MVCTNCVAIPIVVSVLLFSVKCTGLNLTSPCPRLFVYENNTEAEDRWYGAITLLSDYDLNGVWLRVVFDKPVGHIKTTFGDVVPRDINEYLIKNRDFKLIGSIPHTVRFYIQYATHETPANFVGFRLNGKLMCPEVDPSGTTTERLFTSWKADEHKVSEHFESSKVTTDDGGVLYISKKTTNTSLENGTTPLSINKTDSGLLTYDNREILYISTKTNKTPNVPVETDPMPLPLGDVTVALNTSKIFAGDNSTNEVESNLTEGPLYVSNQLK